jgi:large subunit ribosomal protein L29|tara:strand:+ start:309 stop:515 length:207 start_codon:yes stop_codon:yes gene_type:complete
VKVQEVRSLDDQQIEEEIQKSYRELMSLRFKAATNQVTDTNEPNNVRKTLARLYTVKREREILGETNG